MILKSLVKVLLLAAVFAPTAQAEERWAINAIRYENHGDYDASFYFQYEFDGGQNGVCKLAPTLGSGIKPGESVTIQLDNSDGKISSCDVDFSEDLTGLEVYGIVIIEDVAKDPEAQAILWKKNCRKFGTRFHWDPNGGTAIVKSGGTAERNNRCQLVEKGGVAFTGEIR